MVIARLDLARVQVGAIHRDHQAFQESVRIAAVVSVRQPLLGERLPQDPAADGLGNVRSLERRGQAGDRFLRQR